MDLTSLGMKAIHDFDEVRQSPLPQERLKAARKQALLENVLWMSRRYSFIKAPTWCACPIRHGKPTVASIPKAPINSPTFIS